MIFFLLCYLLDSRIPFLQILSLYSHPRTTHLYGAHPLTVTILFLGSALFLVTSFHAMSPFLGSLCYTYHHYLLILGPLTFTVHAL